MTNEEIETLAKLFKEGRRLCYFKFVDGATRIFEVVELKHLDSDREEPIALLRIGLMGEGPVCHALPLEQRYVEANRFIAFEQPFGPPVMTTLLEELDAGGSVNRSLHEVMVAAAAEIRRLTKKAET